LHVVVHSAVVDGADAGADVGEVHLLALEAAPVGARDDEGGRPACGAKLAAPVVLGFIP
jgi:hypothetical protein